MIHLGAEYVTYLIVVRVGCRHKLGTVCHGKYRTLEGIVPSMASYTSAVIVLVPALQMRLQPARRNTILAEPAYQHFVVRKVLEQVHDKSNPYIQGVLRF
jgi:hypothetical protein